MTDCGASGTQNCSTAGRLLRIDLGTGMPSVLATGLNTPMGIAIQPGGATALVSEINPGDLIQVNLGTGSFNIIASGLQYPGQPLIESGGKTALVPTYSGVVRVNLTAKTVTTVSSLRGISAIALESGGKTLLATEGISYVGSLVRIYLDTGQVHVLAPNFLNAANSLVLQGGGTALIAEARSQAGPTNTGAIMQFTVPVEPSAPGVASTASLSMATTAYAGYKTPLAITIKDAYGNVVSGYTGTVSFTSTDTAAVLPRAYTFTSADVGQHTFTVELNSLGSQSVTVAGTGLTPTSATTNVVTPTPATAVKAALPSASILGAIETLTVTIANAAGAAVQGFTGTVSFSSSDKAAVLPAAYTFTSADAGQHAFSVKFGTTGAQSVTVASGGLSSAVAKTTVTDPVSQVVLSGLAAKETAGQTVHVTVTAEDMIGRTETGFTGRVAFTSTDKAAILPAAYTFVAADADSRTFAVVLKTAGAQTLTVTSAGLTSGQQSTTVAAAASAKLSATLPSTATVAQQSVLAVSVLDVYGNLEPAFTGKVSFTSTDKAATLPAAYTFTATDAGKHTFQVKFGTLGTESVTVASSGLTSGTASTTVKAASAVTLTITTLSLPQAVAGASYSFALSALGGTPPYTWHGHLAGQPAGSSTITVSASGVLSGVALQTGILPLVATVRDAAGLETSVQFDFRVTGDSASASFAGMPPEGAEGAPYHSNFPLAPGAGLCAPSLSLIDGVLPPGLTLGPGSPSSLAGTPATAGSFTFTLQGTGCGTAIAGPRSFTVHIAPPASPLSPPGSSNWVRPSPEPVLEPGAAGWDDFALRAPSLVKVENTYLMYYEGKDQATHTRQIGRAVSTDGIHWSKSPSGPVFTPGPAGAWDAAEVRYPTVLFDGTTYRMWYWGGSEGCNRIGLATSSDGIAWKRLAAPLNLGSCAYGENLAPGSVLPTAEGFALWYWLPGGRLPGLATSKDGVRWSDRGPVNLPVEIAGALTRPQVILDGGTYRMWFAKGAANSSAEHAPQPTTWNQNVGYATSADGINWQLYPASNGTVFTAGAEGAWDRPGVGEGWVLLDGSTYKMWYAAGRINLPAPGSYQFPEGSIGYAIIP